MKYAQDTDCKIENVTADGVVSGQVILVNGVPTPTQWREIHLDKYYCDCGKYFTQSELEEHFDLNQGKEQGNDTNTN